jgi:hypothetical protein
MNSKKNFIVTEFQCWILRKLLNFKGFYFPEKRHGHGMCTGQFKNKYGAFMFGGYGHER